VAGKSMERADSLNRRINWIEGVERDNKNQILWIKECLKIKKWKKDIF